MAPPPPERRDPADETGLPASVEAAWGLRGRPTKGPRPGIGVERIVDAAVKLAATEGLQAVSMGRVAKELGASTMSLYRYVAAKDELFILMQEAATGLPPEDAPPPRPAGAPGSPGSGTPTEASWRPTSGSSTSPSAPRPPPPTPSPGWRPGSTPSTGPGSTRRPSSA